MELKGKNVEKLPKTKKQKMEETLKRMEETRNKDDKFLRDVIEQKLKWAMDEKEKGLKTIEKQFQQIKDNQDILMKIDGIILVLRELLGINPENIKEEK